MTRFWRRCAWWSTFLVLGAFSIWTLTSAVHLHASHASCTAAHSLTPLARLPEASSIAPSRRTPGLLWAVNDSGAAQLFGLNGEGAVTAAMPIPGAKVTDWEDVSVGPCPAGSCVYLADIGDNHRTRREVEIYRFPEPAPRDAATPSPEVFHASYEDGPHDAESAFVTSDGQLFVVTKDSPAVLYRLESPLKTESTLRLTRVASISAEPAVGKHVKRAKVTDAEASPDGKWVALRTGDEVAIYPTDALINGKNPVPMLVALGGLAEPQGEGVALTSAGMLYLVGEGGARGEPGTFASLSCKLWH